MQLDGKEQTIHISEIDDFLARGFAAAQVRPFRIRLSPEGDQGYLKALISDSEETIDYDGIDFELSPGENGGLDDFDAGDFIAKPVYTTSAYDFFDCLLARFDSVECVVEFRENAWLVRVVKTS